MKGWWTLCVAAAAVACTSDSPVGVGEGLLPPESIRTFEVILEPERYLVFDSAFSRYSDAADAEFTILANAFDGVLDSRVLVTYDMPAQLVLRDSTASGILLRPDSAPAYFAGTIVLRMDSLTSTRAAGRIDVFRTTEPWDRRSATWTLRADTAGVRLPWTQPGGSPGELVTSVEYPADADSVVLPIDSATVAFLRDTTNAARGLVIATATPGTRLRANLPSMVARAHSSIRDTVLTTIVAPGRTFIFQPAPGIISATPRVGGTPQWRTFFRMRERLDTITVACPGEPGCRVRLSEATISYAAVQLQPVPAPAGLVPESPVLVSVNAALPSPLVPLERSPLTTAVGGLTAPIPVSSFTAPDAPLVELHMTDFLRLAFAAPSAGTTFVPQYFALLPAGTSRTFGIGTFASMPRLRLILTTARDLQLQ